jgi:hypothetical protein
MKSRSLNAGGCLIATFLSGCLSTSEPPSTDQEKSATMQVYISCLHSAALKMDDGKSDAASVALATAALPNT